MSSSTVPRRLPPSLGALNNLEARALDFFRLQVGPALAMHSSEKFWRTLVLQISHQEPAVRHALACIGSTYEGLDDVATSPLKLSRQRFALSQYNLALKHVSSPGVANNIVLVVCLLFICIESMQENRTMAIEHCRHGIIISNEASGQLADWAHDLRPIFLRVATLPYFFGQADDFPRPVGLIPEIFDPIEDLDDDVRSMAWDGLVNKAVRLVRLALNNRRDITRNEPIPQSLLDEQKEILDTVGPWDRYYRQLRIKHTNKDPDTFSTYVHFEIQSIIIKVWTASCLIENEMLYDNFMADFERILSLTQHVIAVRATSAGTRPKFIFEMGYMPLLYFVVLSCRRLDLRLIALRHALLLACQREHLFSTRILYPVGVRVVELEHGIKLDPARPQYEGALTAPLPLDEVRIRSADITDEIEVRPDEKGEKVEYRRVWFLVQPGAIVPGFIEWIKTGPYITDPATLPPTSPGSPAGWENICGIP